jgi:hypothetical protein
VSDDLALEGFSASESAFIKTVHDGQFVDVRVSQGLVDVGQILGLVEFDELWLFPSACLVSVRSDV